MLRHLFILIWNKKKQNFVLMLEMFVSFLVIFGIFSAMVYYFKNYRKPMNFVSEDVWLVEYHLKEKPSSKDSVFLFFDALRNQLQSMREIRGVSFVSNNTPFSMSNNMNARDYKDKHISGINTYSSDDNYHKVLEVQLVEGRWFGKADDGAKYQPLVINQKLSTAFFGHEPAVGKILDERSEHPFRVIGVVNDLKDKGDYSAVEYGMWHRLDSGAYNWVNKVMLKVSPGASRDFESRLYKTLSAYLKNGNIEIEHLSDKRKDKNQFTLLPVIIGATIAAFLVINVALGLFGVLWYNINRRRGEIGLRRAVGATGRAVTRQLVYEALTVATLSLIVGLFFAVQFPLLHVFNLSQDIYFIAMGLAVLFIYLLVIVCALYPGKQAATIYPAVALHED